MYRHSITEDMKYSNTDWSHCKHRFFMQTVISSWLMSYEWSLVTFNIRRVLCQRNEKTLPLTKKTGRRSCNKQREGQGENKILFNNPWVLNILFIFTNQINMSWRFGFPLRLRESLRTDSRSSYLGFTSLSALLTSRLSKTSL